MFRIAKGRPGTILEKDIIDEVIFKTEKPRNRLMVELMARGGMRIGEVLKLRVMNIEERKLRIKDPKSGRQYEFVFIPQKVADRLKTYIQSKGLDSEQRVFSLGYHGAREVVKNAGESIGINLRPHDLRRHSATYASRAGTPLEIVKGHSPACKFVYNPALSRESLRYRGNKVDRKYLRLKECQGSECTVPGIEE